LRRVVIGMNDTDAGLGKVVVNRAMSLDGFIAGPDDAMDWVIEYMKDDPFPEVMRATGAMLIGRGTHEVSKRMSDEDTDYDGGPVFVLTTSRRTSRSKGSHSLAATSRRPSPRRAPSRAGRIWKSSVPT
jgi:dihydrofolate reductase